MKKSLDASDKEWLEFIKELEGVLEFIHEKGIDLDYGEEEWLDFISRQKLRKELPRCLQFK